VGGEKKEEEEIEGTGDRRVYGQKIFSFAAVYANFDQSSTA